MSSLVASSKIRTDEDGARSTTVFAERTTFESSPDAMRLDPWNAVQRIRARLVREEASTTK
jgi:hypothetical protein